MLEGTIVPKDGNDDDYLNEQGIVAVCFKTKHQIRSSRLWYNLWYFMWKESGIRDFTKLHTTWRIFNRNDVFGSSIIAYGALKSLQQLAYDYAHTEGAFLKSHKYNL